MAQIKPDPNDEFVDQLSEEVQKGNKEKGQKGIPTQADIIAKEQEMAEGKRAYGDYSDNPLPPQKPAAQPAPKPEPKPKEQPAADDDKPPKPKEDGEFDYDILLSKLEKDEDLSDEEQAFLDQERESISSSELPDEVKSKEYKIAGKIYSFEDMEKQMREKTKLGDVELPVESRAELVETYVKTLNRTEQQRAVAKREQELAREREDITGRLKELEFEERAMTKEWERLQSEKTKAEAMAKLGMKKEDTVDPETGAFDPDRFYNYTKQQEAKERLEDINNREKDLRESQNRVSTEITRNRILEFIQAHPEYETKEPIDTAINNFLDGKKIDPDDEIKVLELSEILEQASTRRLPMEKIHLHMKAKKQIGVQPESDPAQPGGKGDSPPNLPRTPKSDRKKLIAEIRAMKEKRNRIPGDLGGGSTGTPGSPSEKKSMAKQLIEHDRRVVHGETPDSFLDEIGY